MTLPLPPLPSRWAEGKRVLVTGASGLIGLAAVERFTADGAQVTAVGRTPGPDPAVLSLDLAREPWPLERWNVIVHCAARLPLRFEGPEAEAASVENRALDDRALAAAAISGAHLVYLSTASVYGQATGEIDEETPAAPELDYAREKLATEYAIMGRGLSATVFRLVAPYGPRQTRPTVLLRFLDAALTGAPLRYYGTGSRTQDFIHADDVAVALALAARDRAPGLFLLASGQPISMRELAELVVATTGSTSTVAAAGVPDPQEGRTIRYRVDRLRDRLGFEPAWPLREGIAAWAQVRREALARGVTQ